MRKLKTYEKIITIILIVLSILGITYKVFAAASGEVPNFGAQPMHGTPEEENQGFYAGIIKYEGGSSQTAEVQLDDGVLDFYGGGSGAGGNGGGTSWSWNGIEGFENCVHSSDSGFQPDGNRIWYQDVQDNVGVLCTSQGVGITGKNQWISPEKATGDYWEREDITGTFNNLIAQVELKDPTETYSEKEAEEKMQQVASLDKEVERYTKYFRTPCEYTGSSKSCSPSEAIVLSEVDNCGLSGSNEYTPIQAAWWAVTGTGSASIGGSDQLVEAALDFQNYVNSNLGGEATTHEGYTGFPIKYDPKFNETSQKYTVSFNEKTQQYIIGPFKIDYIDWDPLSFIKNIDIYADNSETPVNKNEYKIVDTNLNEIKVSGTKLKKDYPSSGQEFYILLNYNENFKKITDIQVDFQYMNAGGSYTYYTGTYKKVYIKGHVYGRFSYPQYKKIRQFSEWLSEMIEQDKAIIFGNIYRDLNLENSDLDEIEKYLNKKSEYIEEGAMATAFNRYDMSVSSYDNKWTQMVLQKFISADNKIIAADKNLQLLIANGGMPIEAEVNVKETIEYWIEYLSGLESDATDKIARLDKIKKDEKRELTSDEQEEYDQALTNKKEFGEAAEQLTNLKNSMNFSCEGWAIPGKLTIDLWENYEYIPTGDLPAQAQSVNRGAARWWEYKTIHWKDLSPDEGKIKITKKFDKDNQAKEGDTFNFEVTVYNHRDNKDELVTTTETLTLTYHEGQEEQYVESSIYKWNDGDSVPTYKIVEKSASPNNSYSIDSSVKTGSLENGKTVSVTCTNHVDELGGSLEIKKDLEETKLDDDGTYKNSKYKFKVTITGKCEFTFNGKNYSLNDNESVVLNDKTSENPNQDQIQIKPGETWKLENIKWYGSNEPPTYVVEEIVEPITANGRTYTYTTNEIINSTGSLNNTSTITVIAKNKPDTSNGKIKIFKTLENSDKLSEEELQKLTFKFKVNVYSDSNYTKKLKNAAGEEYQEKEIITTIKRENNEDGTFYWCWEGTTDEYVWLKGNKAYYKIEEDKNWCPMHQDKECPLGDECFYKNSIKFKSSENSITTGEIVQKENIEEFTPAKPINEVIVTNPSKGKIVINKTLSSELNGLINDDYKVDIVLKVSGTFGIDKNGNGKLDENEWYNDVTLQIPNKSDSRTTIDYDKIVELSNSTDYDKNTFITFTKADFSNPTFSFTTPEIYWYGEAPKFEILEDTKTQSVTTTDGAVKEVHSSGIPNGWKSFADVIKDENDTYTYPVDIENGTDEYNSGYIHLIKKLENQEWCTADYIKSLKFRFKIEIKYKDGNVKSTEYVTLGDDINPVIYDEQNDEYRWEYTTGKYSWKKTEPESQLKYTVTELDSYDGIVLDRAEEIDSNGVGGKQESFDLATKSLSGTLKDAGESENKDNIKINTTNCQFVNKISDTSPLELTIKIKKKFTTSDLTNDDNLKIQYKVNITGKFEYNGNKYNGTYVIDNSGNIKEQYNDSNEYVTITKNNNWKWESSKIKYFGEKPTYSIEEVENYSTTLVSSQNSNGNIGNTAEFVNAPQDRGGYLSITKEVKATDDSNIAIDENQVFTFKVTIGGNVQYVKLKYRETWTSNYIKWKAGESAPEYSVEEIMDNVSGYELNTIKNKNGSLEEGQTVNVIATNKVQSKSSNFIIAKEIIFNKLINDTNSQKFSVNVKIIGDFKIGNELYKSSENKIYTNTIELSANGAWQSPKITWWGDNAPTVIVEEVQKEGWSIPEYSNNGNTGLKLQENSSNRIVITNRIKVELDLMMKLAGVVWNDTAEKPDEKDQDKNTPNGRYDSEREQGIEGVQVNVYRVINNSAGKEVKREKAISYSGPFEVETLQPIITAKDGSWQMTGLRVTGFTEAEKTQYFSSSEIANRDFSKYSVKYDVEFIYDGQTYEPTKLLEYYDDKSNTDKKSTRVEDYLSNPAKSSIEKDGNNSRFVGYYIDSLALDYDRETVNNRIQKVYGKTAIDGNGNTVGEVSGDSGKNSILYEADVPSNSARVQSKLQTRDNESNVSYDLYKTTARTSVAGLEFPVKNTYQLEYTGTEYTINGVKQYYRALYEDSLHINLGLKNRKDVDIDATKDLESAKVIVDGKEINYTFNSLADILNQAGLKSLDKTSSTDGRKITYELGLYKTDYYYRAELYKTNADVYDNIQTYYKNLTGKGIEDSELEVYLTYRINLYNSSPTTQYAVKINEVADYFDSSFGAPIQEKVIKNVNDEAKVVAEPSYITKMKEVDKNGEKEYNTSDKTTIKWNVSKENIKGSDGGTYNKMTADLSGLNIKLASGENRDIFVTFAVKKDTINEVEDCIALGNKSNIVEISNYSTYYAKGATMYCDKNNNEIKAESDDIIAGKIDKDSAPDNVNIENFNDEKTWYEDDTDAAPVLNITLMDDNRKINGTAWEDKTENNATVGNGIRDDGEALIGGLTTELIEKITIPNVEGTGENAKAGNERVEYDFLWPTNEQLSCLGGKTLKQLTGFDSTTETSRENSTLGQYNFTGIPTGTYVVRFLYGNNKLDLEDTEGIDVKPATAYNVDGTLYSGNESIYTANYDEDSQSQTPAVYNGQDYKSTIYQTGFNSLNNTDYDLISADLKNADVSDARDSEYRRLEVIANSETITNVNSSILDSATDISANHNELYEGYSMFADTAKIDLNIEYSTDVSQLKGLDVEKAINTNKGVVSPVVQVNSTTDTFTVPKVDFGLIERPETKVVLDKEIKGIKITTNSNKTIFDAEYNISYEIVEADEPPADRVVVSQVSSGKYLVAKVEISDINSKGTDQLQQIDKNEKKLENDAKTGTQNFRYINVDTEILQGTTVELTYLLTALNVGETDYTSNIIDEITNITSGAYGTGETTGDPSINIRESIESLAKYTKLSNSKWTIQETENVYETYENWLANNDTYQKYYDTWKTSGVSADYKGYGTYLGMYYYTGDENDSNNRIVTSKIRQLVDYVDNDATFTEEYNGENNHLWKNTTINELSGNGYEKNRLISKDVIPEYEILDKNNISYVTDRRNNLILSVDDQSQSNDVIKSNSGFESKLEPIKYYTINKSGRDETDVENNIRTSISDLTSKLIELKKQNGKLPNEADNLPTELQQQDGEKTLDYADRLLMEYYKENGYISQITLTVTKTVSSQDDTKNMQYDNLAEVVKYENSVGRRDVTSISGNANPKEGEFKTAQKERDSSATELITFAPPTGIEVQNVMKNQILIIVIASLCGVAIGIIVIKKKILK